jgi:hypothetical protein
VNEVLTQEAERLLKEIAVIQKRFEDEAHKTGSKFNIFEITGSGRKEVPMCRVLAELFDPKGRHGKGSLYLKLLWETVSPKLPDALKNLDLDTARVSTEYPTDAMRRIDITIEAGRVFVPIEVKIGAGDQQDQIRDYFDFARKHKNGGAPVPVLYLTLDGHLPTSAHSPDEYRTLSFNDDIIPWLEECLVQRETENTHGVRETLKQLVGAVKQLCDNSEDTKMTNEIFEMVAQSANSVKAALAMSEAAGLFKRKALEAFKCPVTELVKKSFPTAEYADEKAGGWYSLCVPIRKDEYLLYVNYDWKAMTVQSSGGERDSETEKKLSQKMMELTGCGGSDGNGSIVWASNDKKFCYPTLVSVDESLYFYELYKLYKERPQEAADEIKRITHALEKV